MAMHTNYSVLTDDVDHETCGYHIARPAQKRPLFRDVSARAGTAVPLYRPEVMKTIEDEIDIVTEEVRKLNEDIWSKSLIDATGSTEANTNIPQRIRS